MSVEAKINNKWLPVAGMGSIEYGASTVRHGTITTDEIGIGSFAVFTVTFDTPMPDDDYRITHNWNTAGGNITFAIVTITEKTANGFKLYVRNSDVAANPLTSHILSWCAFKLHSVQGLEELENSVSDLETITSGYLTVANSGLVSVGSGIGSLTVAFTKVGKLVTLTVQASQITNVPTAGTYESLQVAVLSEKYRPLQQIDVTVHFQGNEVPYIMNIRPDGNIVVWQWGEPDTMTGAFSGSATYISAK